MKPLQTIVNLVCAAFSLLFLFILVKGKLNPWGYYACSEPNDLVFWIEVAVILPAVVVAAVYLTIKKERREA